MDMNWLECLNNKKILITGASSDMGVALLQNLAKYNMFVGAHYLSNSSMLI